MKVTKGYNLVAKLAIIIEVRGSFPYVSSIWELESG